MLAITIKKERKKNKQKKTGKNILKYPYIHLNVLLSYSNTHRMFIGKNLHSSETHLILIITISDMNKFSAR